MMKLRLANPDHLVDINDLAELSYIREEQGEIRIGAMVRHAELLESDLLAERFPVFRDAEQVIADPVVRNRGTIGGSLCQADAAEDLSAVCAAVKARVVIRGAEGDRVVGMDEFHVGPYMTAVGAGEMLTEIRLSALGRAPGARTRRSSGGPATGRSPPPRRRSGSRRRRRRRRDRAQRGGIDHRPRAPRRGAADGQGARRELFAEAGEDRVGGLLPTADGRGPVDYKRHLAGVLTQRALRRAASRATEQEV